jgi:hypothetical protein
MWFRSKKSLEEPMPIMDLPYMAYFCQGSNGILHDGCLLWPIDDFLDGNRLCVPGINDTFVVLDGDENAFVVEDRPIFLDNGVDFIMYMGLEMQQVKIASKLLTITMGGLVVSTEEGWVHLIKQWWWVLEFMKDWSSFNIVEQVLVVLGLVRETPVIDKDIGYPLLAFGLNCNVNGWQNRIGQWSCSSAEGVG